MCQSKIRPPESPSLQELLYNALERNDLCAQLDRALYYLCMLLRHDTLALEEILETYDSLYLLRHMRKATWLRNALQTFNPSQPWK